MPEHTYHPDLGHGKVVRAFIFCSETCYLNKRRADVRLSSGDLNAAKKAVTACKK